MTPKISISILKDDYGKVQKWRKSVNFSKICQAAIMREIAAKEQFYKKIEEEKQLAEIWKDGDLSTPESQFQVGKEMGFYYACNAPYHEVKNYESYAEGFRADDNDVIERFHYNLDFASLLVDIGIMSEELADPDQMDLLNENVITLSPKFDYGFMEGIIDYIEKSFKSNEVQELALKRDAEMKLIKDEDEKFKVFLKYSKKIQKIGNAASEN